MRRPDRGATLAELAVVLAIAAAAFAVAAPDLHALVTAQQLKAASGELHDAILHTRAQAIARNEQVKLAPRDPGGADWTRGWTVFIDRDGDRQPSAADEVLAVHGPLPQGVRIDFSFTQSAPPQYIAYNGAGRSCSDTNSGAARLGTLSLFHGGQTRRIKINMLGRIRQCNPARDDGCEGAQAPR
ncbi:GspH/FimT family protein [Massilia sp. BSC265]|uniref:GspH/FimT family protein n=1 Tax=Massilia sp. BSC265 TaxID=1549812 RepID=UPI0004E8F8F3|nr:GspH/FimT family protein [Massilia sp. BSC265]KFI08617.1 type-4 fimbrial pilin related signal peptide protein [Massilia sp. BSC265]